MNKKLIIIVLIIIVIVGILCLLFLLNKENIQETLPYLLDDQCEVIEAHISKGMTIKDSLENEWVWIVVPKTKVFLTAKSETDYTNILSDIKEYVKDYSDDEYEDIDVQKNLLTSIYKYGGFWISRYEIGTEELRTDIEKINEEPFSKPNKYVYNYVTLEQAEELSKRISNGKYESSLLYGFQWDLICKFIEENAYKLDNSKITKAMINSNSSSWGNYYSSSFIMNRSKGSSDYGETYKDINEGTTKKAYNNLLLTTGASEQNKACNIYDFAGNVSEWTLEKLKNDDKWCIIRDGSFYFNYGGNDPVNGRYQIDSDSSSSSYGFRVGIFK